jgi:hypothetical protein
MGLRAGLIEISATSLAQVKAGETLTEDELKTYAWTSLDKAWYEFYRLFKRMVSSLKYAISGDYPHPLGPQSLDEFAENGISDFYIGFVSPSIVKDICLSLAELSNQDINRMYGEIGLEFDKYSQSYLENLRHAYSRATANTNALCICIS